MAATGPGVRNSNMNKSLLLLLELPVSRGDWHMKKNDDIEQEAISERC